MKINNIRVIDDIWFPHFGIVKGLDEVTGETKFYVGASKGVDRQHEIFEIVRRGTKIDEALIKNFFSKVESSPNLTKK